MAEKAQNKAPSRNLVRSFVFINNLAPCYFPVGQPPKYRCRCDVSPPSSRWVGVVPSRLKHQESWVVSCFWLVVSCGLKSSPNKAQRTTRNKTLKTAQQRNVNKTRIRGQALGLLVRFGYIHYCTSTLRLSTGNLPVTLLACAMRALIWRWASHLDAFSGYPLRTWLPSVYRWHDNWYTSGASLPVLSY